MPRYSAARKEAAVHDYATTDMPSSEIAKKYRVSLGAITAWVKRAGFQLRGRGRRRRQQPNARAIRVLALVELYTYENAAKRLGTTKQNIYRIVKRWGEGKASSARTETKR